MSFAIRQRGLTLLELVLSLTILSVAFIGIDALSERLSQDTRNALVAAHMRTFGDAVRAFVKANQNTIEAGLIAATTATNTAARLITVDDLIAGNFLSPSQGTLIPSTNTRNYVNGYGQALCSLVIRANEQLQALVVAEGGQQVNDLDLGSIAALIGGGGGSVLAGNVNIIWGAVGAWNINVSDYVGQNITNNQAINCSRTAGQQVVVNAGRPVMALWFDTTRGVPLARNGGVNPELNTMTTPLIMNATNKVVGGLCAAGSISNDAAGALLYCDNLVWRTFPNRSSWQPPVAAFNDLPLVGNQIGDVRVTTAEPNVTLTQPGFNAPYMWTGNAWKTLTADKYGTLNINALVVNGSISNTGDITSNGKIQGQSIAASGAIIGSSLTLNATGVPEVLPNGTMKLGSVELGSSCNNNGALARDSSNGMVVYCGVNRFNDLLSWKSVVLQGTFCGMTGLLADEHIACDGLDIRDNTDSTGSGSGCPPGYYKRNIAYIGNNTPTMRTCVKQY